MAAALLTEVYGKIPGTIIVEKIQQGVVGKLHSEFPINSSTFEIITLEFEGDYSGVITENAANVMTFAKNIAEVERCITSPVITITSSYQMPIHTLTSGMISTVEPPTPKKHQLVRNDGSCQITIITPGPKSNTVVEWSFRIPDCIRMDRKVIYIKKFDFYLTGCSVEQLIEIRDGNTVVPELIGKPKPLVDIHIRGNVDCIKPMYFSFNGIMGDVLVEPCGDVVGTITLRVGSSVFVEHISNKDFIHMDATIYKLWKDYGGIDLLIDIDRDRLSRMSEALKASKNRITPENIDIVSDLRSVNAQMATKIEEQANIIREHEKALKLKMEELRTKREEIKFQGSVADQRFAAILDAIKLGGALLGTTALVLNLMAKAQQQTQKKIIEWTIPVMIKKGFTKSIYLLPMGGIVIGSIAVGALVVLAYDHMQSR